jgi:LAS superfamily LD-carboxypeptidase LdcB
VRDQPLSPAMPPAATPPPASMVAGDSETDTAAPATPPPEARRLAWVNPARCHQSCAYHPGDALRRVGDLAAPDPRGSHRVDAAALPPLRDLLAAARAAGHAIRITSAFRPYDEQLKVFRTTKEKGRAARPGHSEHQLGTAIDLRLPTSAAIAWLAEHAPAHGFALSYPPGKQRLTGYRPEPWHVRFVGRELAEELRRRGWTLEELFRARPDLAESGTCQDCPSRASRMACGRTTERGSCRGTVLTWCYQGSLAIVDCAVSHQECGHSPDAGLPDCLPATTEGEAQASGD